MGVINPQPQPEIRKEGVGAAVYDPYKVSVRARDAFEHISSLSEDTRARSAAADSPVGEVFTLVVEVRLTKYALGGERSRRITADIVQALLDRSVAEHIVAMHAQGEPPKVAGFTVRRGTSDEQ